MNDSPQRKPLSPHEITAIYARLHPQDVEQFYTGYQLWTISQQIARLQADISAIQKQLSEHRQRMQQVQPSSIALVALAHLQAHGVNDNELLNRMLARGEDWLEQTMQYLVYCEEINVMRDNYTEWCQHALEGAYDWLGSMQLQHAETPTDNELSVASGAGDIPQAPSLNEATEEILLQKLLSDEPEEDEEALLTTLKRSSVSPPETHTPDILPDPSPPTKQPHAPGEQVIEEEQPEPIVAREHIEPPGEPAFSEYGGESSSAAIHNEEPDRSALEEVIVGESDEAVHAEQGEAEPVHHADRGTRKELVYQQQDSSIIIIHRKRGFLQWLFSLFLRR